MCSHRGTDLGCSHRCTDWGRGSSYIKSHGKGERRTNPKLTHQDSLRTFLWNDQAQALEIKLDTCLREKHAGDKWAFHGAFRVLNAFVFHLLFR